MHPLKNVPVYLTAITHKCGNWMPVEELVNVDSHEIAIPQLKKLGIHRYSQLKSSLRDLTKEQLAETLQKSDQNPSEVDAAIFFSTTLDAYHQHSDVALALDELNLSKAIPYGVFHNQCTNHSQALQLAQMLCASGQAKKILIFGYDALNELLATRILANRTSVYSDVFVSCLVSSEPVENSFRIDLIHHHFAPEVLRYQTPENALRFITSYSENFKLTCEDALNHLNSLPSDYQYLITPNYNFSVVNNLAELAGFPVSRLFMDNISRYSHCFSADHLIALQTLETKQISHPGDRYFLTAVGGFVVFSAIALTRV